MTKTTIKTALFAVFTAILLASAVAPASADIKNYEFQLVKNEVKKGDGAIVDVRLMNTVTQKPVSDAVIFAQRIDMAPDGMEMMASPIKLMPTTEPGLYRFETSLSMEGRWRLSLSAKVQGEQGSVESQLILKAVP